MKNLISAIAVLLSCTAAFATASVSAAPAAGEVVLVTGRGTATSPANGEIRTLARGASVFSGEILSAGPNSYVNVKFSDGARVLLRPNSRFQIEDYVFESEQPEAEPTPEPATAPSRKATQSAIDRIRERSQPPPEARISRTASSNGDRSYYRLLKGGFRAVTGLIGKAQRENFKVSTAVATIGIRGTDFELYLCDAACQNDPVLQSQLPEGATLEGSLIVVGHSGTVFIAGIEGVDTALPTTDVNAGESFNVTLKNVVRLNKRPRFLQVDPTPDPLLCDEE